jgi:hypothetical protein
LTVLERTGETADEYVKLLGPEVADGKGPVGQKIVAGEYGLNALVAKVESGSYICFIFISLFALLTRASAAKFKLDSSYFGRVDLRKEPQGILENFETLMRKQRDKFVAEIKKAATLGYAFKANTKGKSPLYINSFP